MHSLGRVKPLLFVAGSAADFLDAGRPLVEVSHTFSDYLGMGLALNTAAIVVLQYFLARRNLALAFYDKRYPVYIEATDFIAEISNTGSLSQDRLRQFTREARDKAFLFADDVGELLIALHAHGYDLMFATEDYHAAKRSQDEEALRFASNKLFEETNWFRQQRQQLKPLFERYLRVYRKYRLGIFGALSAWIDELRSRSALRSLDVPIDSETGSVAPDPTGHR